MSNNNEESWFYRLDRALLTMIEKELEKNRVQPEGIGKFYKEVITDSSQDIASKIFETLRMNMPTVLKKNRETQKSFEKKIYGLWKEPLDMLEAFLHLSIEIGFTINRELRSKVGKNDYVLIDVLTRLHGRACLIGGEILNLLRGGYADAANARWRSLHETVVFFSFIREKGNDVAERYLRHNTIESFKALREYQENAKTLKLTPFSNDECKKISSDYEKLIKEYGKSYKNQYGWASSALNIKNPTFRDIENVVHLKHLRPYYRMASHHIHSNPKSLLFKLGLLNLSDDVILVGPSNAGLADAGQGMVISLNQINCGLLAIKPGFLGLITANVITIWVEETLNKFIQVHRIVEKRWYKTRLNSEEPTW